MNSKGINKVILIGHLGQNPEIRYTSGNIAVSNITIATSENWRDKNTNEVKERVEWHKIVLFGKLAEIAVKYLKKGSQVYIEGSLQTRKWKDKNGLDRYNTEIIVNMNGKMYMLGSNISNLNNSKKSDLVNETDDNNSFNQNDTEDNFKSKLLEEDMSNIEFDEELPF